MDHERENKLHEIIQHEIQKHQAINLYITHITGVLCKIHQPDGKWIPGRVLFSRKDGNCAYVYTEPSLPIPWIDFSARSDHAVLFTTEQIFYQSKLARKFRGTIKGLTIMRCFNDGLYIEFFPPDSTSRIVSSTQCQPFDTSQTDSLDPLTRTSLQRELSYISRIRLMITNLLSSTAGDTTSTPLIAKTGQFLPHPIEANNTSPLPADIPPNIQKNVNPPMPLTNQSNLYLGPRAPLAQMNVIPFRQNPSVLPRPNISMYSPLASRPPSLPKTNPPRGVPRPPRPPQSQMPPRTAPIQKPPNSSESMTSQTQSKHQPISAPLRYELTNDPFPNWKKEVLIPGWTSQTEWIGKPQIQFTPPGSSIPLLSKQAVKAYVLAREEFKSIHHLINAFDFREVFCLCHKPEISEVITYMECMANVAGCNRWFHPECAGWDRFELDQYEIDIICPLCTEYMEQNPAVNSLIERRLYLNFLKNKMNPESIYSDPARSFQVMRLKGKGKYYLTDKSGLPEPHLRELRRSQVDQRCPKVVEQGKLEILAFNHPLRVWGIGVGAYSYEERPLLPADQWYQSEESLVKGGNTPIDRAFEPLVGTIDTSKIASKPTPREEITTVEQWHDSVAPLETTNVTSSAPSTNIDHLLDTASHGAGKFAIPWMSGTPPATADPRLKEDIRIASTIESSGKHKFVYVSIRGGWKELPSYDRMTHDQRVQLSTQSAISLDQRLQRNILQECQNAVKKTGEEAKSSVPVFGPVSIGDGAIVSTMLLPGSLPSLAQFCKQRCAFCFDIFSSRSQQMNDHHIDRQVQKKSKIENSTTPMAIGTFSVHALCHDLITQRGFQSVLDRTLSKGLIEIKDILIDGESVSDNCCCNLCGREGGILCQFSLLTQVTHMTQRTLYGHGLCLQILAESGILRPSSIERLFVEIFDKFPCSYCGQQLGITYCCNHPTCHNRAHHICGLQAGWNIGTLDVDSFNQSSGNLFKECEIFCYLCPEHSFS